MPTRNFKDENDCGSPNYFKIVFDLFWDMVVLRALQRNQRHAEQSLNIREYPCLQGIYTVFLIKRSL